MAKSAIGYFTLDNTIRAVTCQNEGYIDGVGLTLIKKYSKDWEVVEDLVEGGNIDFLSDSEVEYTRNKKVIEVSSESEYLDYAINTGCEYMYLFLEEFGDKRPMWYVARPDTDFVPIVDRMMSEDEGYLTGVS